MGGAHVAIRGLRNHIELNGCLGRVVECNTETHRFEVRATESGQLFRVKQENLVPIDQNTHISSPAKESPAKENSRSKKEVAGGASSSAAAAGGANGASGETEETFEPGTMVVLVGLKTASSFNGQEAEVLSVDHVRGRYEIRLQDGSVKTIRAENVRLIGGGAGGSPPKSKRL